ncbi:ras-related protein Rab-17 isoform X2 [Marmota marmota marmota]|uniref:ras-related protein Rab-17 isoform X2 n=1 Tax=Marmota marmota marmota TaxID=9994 RepID=UPI002092A89A|nr:ras-related protein Rab-17 isoform X2 [Marmota marmota marmota]
MAQADGLTPPRDAPGQPRVSKLVLLGSGSVGKSSLVLRSPHKPHTMAQNILLLLNDYFKITSPWKAWEKSLQLKHGVPSAFFTKVVDLGASSLKLEIWDTAGQEKYHSVCHLYFRGANAALLVYDITRKDSFHKARQWLADLEKELHPGEGVVMLVGNKTDLGEQREEGKEFAESNKLLFMETSAKLNLQVSEVFSTVAQELLQREARQSHSAQGDAAVVLNAGPAPQAKCCAR